LKLTLDREDIGTSIITSADLIEFSQFFTREAKLDDIQKDLNRLIDIVQSSLPHEKEISELKKKFRTAVSVTEFSSAIVQLMDSYYSGGVVQQKIISKVIA